MNQYERYKSTPFNSKTIFDFGDNVSAFLTILLNLDLTFSFLFASINMINGIVKATVIYTGDKKS